MSFTRLFTKILDTRIPIGFFASTIILLLCGTVVFGWLAQHVSGGGTRAGAIGDVAFAIAKYPSSVKNAFKTVVTKFSGVNQDLTVQFRPKNFSDYTPIPVSGKIELIGPRQYFTAGRAAGWRVIIGTFNINGAPRSAAIALDPNMMVHHVWHLDETGIQSAKKRGPLYKIPHGFELLPDGSVIFVFDAGVSISRMSVCGERLWSVVGPYHHSVALADAGASLWTLRALADKRQPAKNSSLVKISVADGEIENEISFADLMAANPDQDIFGLRQYDDRPKSNWAKDPFHENDVDPLPAALASAYPNFEEGDLLVSLRSTNLIFVVNPSSRRIKWHRVGASRRQHDPDWNQSGKFTVFDNNMHRENSRLIEIDPITYKTNILIDGEYYNFYSWQRGKHQFLPNNSALVTSSHQGRAFEVDRNGNTVFEFVNYGDAEASFAFIISEARWVPADFFQFDTFPECPDRR